MPSLPKNYVPLECVALVKCLDSKGEPTMVIRSTDGLMAWEAIGMLIAAEDMGRADLRRDLTTWDETEETDDEHGFPEGI